MKKKKIKFDVEEKDNEICFRFSPANTFVIPKEIKISFKKEKKNASCETGKK